MTIYDQINPATGQHYYTETWTANGVPGVLHVYQDGHKEFVADRASPAATPNVVSTGGVPGVPVAAAPAPAPTPAPTVVSSSPQPTSGSTGGTAAAPPAPNWDPNAPSSDLYVNPANGKEYQVQDASASGEWHIYKDGDKVWSPGASWDQSHVTLQQWSAENSPATVSGQTAQPITGGSVAPASSSGSTGGTAAPAAAPAASQSPISVASNTAQPITGAPAPTDTGGTAAPAVSDTSSSAGLGGATYTVAPGDTLSQIAEKNGMSLSQLEKLNPQISNPDLIRPGWNVNLGGPSTQAAPPSPSTSFPEHSTYPPSDNSQPHEAAKIERGWGSGTDSGTSDPAKGIMEASTKTDTDPLKVNNDKPHQV